MVRKLDGSLTLLNKPCEPDIYSVSLADDDILEIRIWNLPGAFFCGNVLLWEGSHVTAHPEIYQWIKNSGG